MPSGLGKGGHPPTNATRQPSTARPMRAAVGTRGPDFCAALPVRVRPTCHYPSTEYPSLARHLAFPTLSCARAPMIWRVLLPGASLPSPLCIAGIACGRSLPLARGVRRDPIVIEHEFGAESGEVVRREEGCPALLSKPLTLEFWTPYMTFCSRPTSWGSYVCGSATRGWQWSESKDGCHAMVVDCRRAEAYTAPGAVRRSGAIAALLADGRRCQDRA